MNAYFYSFGKTLAHITHEHHFIDFELEGAGTKALLLIAANDNYLLIITKEVAIFHIIFFPQEYFFSSAEIIERKACVFVASLGEQVHRIGDIAHYPYRAIYHLL